MKKFFYTAMIGITLLAASNNIRAQAWSKDAKVLGLGFGASYFFHLDPDRTTSYYLGSAPIWLTGQLNFQGEFGVHDYVGIGFTTGLGGRAGYSRGFYSWYGTTSYSSYGEVNVPVGVLANFHFYQLIADKTGKDIRADKLDVYAGVSVGSGVAVTFYSNTNHIYPIVFGGAHVGARYYFTDKLGANVEVGFGKSIVNGGLVFKL